MLTAHGDSGCRTGLFVLAESAGGAVGIGEVAPLPTHGTESLTVAHAVLSRVEGRDFRLDLGAGTLGKIEGFLERVGMGLDTPAARCGVEVALLDLVGKLAGRRVADLLGGPTRRRVQVNALLGAEKTADLIEEAREACAAGFRTLKAKVGALSIEEDLARIRALRREVGFEVALRLDANRAWNLATARKALEGLEPLAIEFIEEPLADPGQLEALRGADRGGIPLAADESAGSNELINRLLAAGAADVVVLKPAVVGGLGATLRLARAVVAARARVVITSGLDREIGVAAALQVACVVPGLDLACGLATLSRLEAVGCPDFEPTGGTIALPCGTGLGVTLPQECAA